MATGATQPVATPPWLGDSVQWLTPEEFAVLYRRARTTIYLWLHNGTLVEFGFPIYQDIGGRWWIRSEPYKAHQA